MIAIEGQIEKIFASRNNTWASILVIDNSGKVYKAAGSIVNPIVGCNISMTGEIEVHPTYGEQFNVIQSKIKMANSAAGISAYLSSGFVNGVGPAIADRIIDKFGANALYIITYKHEKLIEVKGISKKKAEEIHNSHLENKSYFELINYFNGLATDFQIRTLYEKYGKEVVEKLKENPYRIIYDIRGFGFKKADSLARASGIKSNDPRRIAAAITYVLNKLADDGHCYCYLDSLEGILYELIQKEKTEPVPLELVSDIIANEIKIGHLCLEDNRLYLKYLYKYEVESAEIISSMVNQKPVKNINKLFIEDVMSDVEDERGFTLEIKQKNAIYSALGNRISVITGGPGTGKSTIVECIIRAWNDDSVLLMAPTGKAARRLNEITDIVIAETVHRTINKIHTDLIRAKIENNNTQYHNNLFIIDESSMLDLGVFCEILKCVYATNSMIIFIGDIDQLPPIGAGNAFRDLVKSVFVPTVKLELSHRSKGSIIIDSDKINKGESFGAYLYDEQFVLDKVTPEHMQETVLNRYFELLEFYDVTEVCCLVPTRASRGNDKKTCSEALNKLIKDRVNPKTKRSFDIGNTGFRVGDRVMYRQNNYKKGVFNGDCGVIDYADLDENIIKVIFDSGDAVYFTLPEMSNFHLAYSITVHKSQGSEYKAIVLAQGIEHYTLLQRNLLYTGVTRAKEKVIIVAEPRALSKAIKTVNSTTRNTRLIERIAEKVSCL